MELKPLKGYLKLERDKADEICRSLGVLTSFLIRFREFLMENVGDPDPNELIKKVSEERLDLMKKIGYQVD